MDIEKREIRKIWMSDSILKDRKMNFGERIFQRTKPRHGDRMIGVCLWRIK